MSERTILEVAPRNVVGKKVKQLRRAGLIPAVVYGQQAPVNIQIERGHLRRVLRQVGTRELVDMTVDGNTLTVLAKDIQQHVTRGDLIHIDFYEVNMKETIQIEIELVAVGSAPTAVTGLGSLTLGTHAIEVECLPGDLVSEIEVDFSLITSPDDVIYAKDLVMPAGLTLLTDGDTAVTSFSYTRTEEQEEEEDDDMLVGSAEVEVISRGKDEEEDF